MVGGRRNWEGSLVSRHPLRKWGNVILGFRTGIKRAVGVTTARTRSTVKVAGRIVRKIIKKGERTPSGVPPRDEPQIE